MHSVISVFKVDPTNAERQSLELREQIAPVVKAQVGFVSGYWAKDASAGKIYAYTVWQTETAARSMADAISANRTGNLDSVSVLELIVSADEIQSAQPPRAELSDAELDAVSGGVAITPSPTLERPVLVAPQLLTKSKTYNAGY